MTKFAKPKARFDKNQANTGVWFYIEDENGYEYGGFKCGLFDPTLPRIRLALERAQRKNNGKNGAKRATDKVRDGAEWFVETCMFDWDVKDEAGKAIKFSKEAAVEYFTTTEIDEETGKEIYLFDYVFNRLWELTRDVTNFQSEEQADAGDTTGN